MLKSYLKNIILILFGIIFFFLILEILLRITGQMPSYYYPKDLYISNDILGYRLRPNFKTRQSLGEYSYSININSEGLRDNEHGEKKCSRILGLGDSFTFGTGLELKQTYLSILEDLINSSGRSRYEVIKAGVPGYGTEQELTFLKSFGLTYKPDFVLLGFCVPNDPNDNIRERDIVINGFLVSSNSIKYEKNNFIFYIKAFCRRNLYTYSFIINRLKSKPKLQKIILKSGLGINIFDKELQFYRKSYSKETEMAWKKTFDILRDIKDITDSENIKLYVIFIPTRIQVEKKFRDLIKGNLNIKEEDVDVLKPNKILSSFCEDKGIEFLDLTILLEREINKGRQLYYILDGHWTKEGAYFVAKAIFEYLIQKDYFKNIR